VLVRYYKPVLSCLGCTKHVALSRKSAAVYLGASGSSVYGCFECCSRFSKFAAGRRLDWPTATPFHIVSSSAFTVSPHPAPYSPRYFPLLEWGLDDTLFESWEVKIFFLSHDTNISPVARQNSHSVGIGFLSSDWSCRGFFSASHLHFVF